MRGPGGMGQTMDEGMMRHMGPAMRKVMLYTPQHLLARKDALGLTADQVTRLTTLRDAAKAAEGAAESEAQAHMKEGEQAANAVKLDTSALKIHFEAAHNAMWKAHWAMITSAAHAHMVDDFRRRFWVSLALTIPVLATSEMIQHFLSLRGAFAFPGDRYVEFGFASAVYFYGGRPFLTGLVDELRKRLPGMMTLVALAITVAYAYSALVVFGFPGSVFFWETATLIDIMLLGHWIERSEEHTSELQSRLH